MFVQVLNVVYIVAVVLFLFNLTIFIHELGHFLVGRWRGAKIERFAIWFGPAIWSRTINGVEFRLGCIPLGGYVAFPQLAMESIEGKSETPAEELAPLKPRDKIPILLAGSVANVILGFLVASIVWIVGTPRDASFKDLKVAYVSAKSPEGKAGIQAGDEIISINGERVENWDEIHQKVALSLTEDVRIGFLREGKSQAVEVKPSRDNRYKIRALMLESEGVPYAVKIVPKSPAEKSGLKPGDEFVAVDGIPIICSSHFVELISARPEKQLTLTVRRGKQLLEIQTMPKYPEGNGTAVIGVGLGEKPKNDTVMIVYPTPWQQVAKSVTMMVNTFNALIHTKTTGVGVGDLSGPVGIGHVLFLATQTDIRLALGFLVLLNINLAIINLLPIPVLDGGHIVFTLIESVRRRPLNQKFLEATNTVFIALLLTFMAYVTFNDFARLAGGRSLADEEFHERAKPAK